MIAFLQKNGYFLKKQKSDSLAFQFCRNLSYLAIFFIKTLFSEHLGSTVLINIQYEFYSIHKSNSIVKKILYKTSFFYNFIKVIFLSNDFYNFKLKLKIWEIASHLDLK